jgi:hypothetical protein
MWGRRTGVNLLDTDEMAAFFEQLDHLNEAQLLALRAAWQATSRETHEQAWAAVREVGTSQGLTGEIARVRNRALGWASRGSNSIPYRVSDEVTWLKIKIEAGEAIVDAALAIALGSRLDEAGHDILIGPWLRATQAPD